MSGEDSIVNVVDIKERKKDFMFIRAELRKCNDPIETAETVARLQLETGHTKQTLDRCVREIEKERRDREREVRQQTKEKGRGPSDSRPEWATALLLNKDGEIKDCPFNVVTLLNNHPHWKGRIKKNILSGCTEIDGIQVTDSDIFGILEWCGQEMKMAIHNVKTAHSALSKSGADNGYHPVVDMYESLPAWDGTERMNFLFSDFLGAEQDEYSAYVGRMLLCSMVARAYEPGCIMRRMPVLEGPELAGKSLFVHDLGHPWSAEISSNMESTKQFEEDIRGVFVAELMEMDALKKASASRIKAAISLRNARYRSTWGYVSEGHPRTTIFVGTVNPNKALNLFDWDDENTRFFPLIIKEYNQTAFLAAKQQLFAESKAYLLAHPTDWWSEPESIKEQAACLRAGRAAVDPWFLPIAEFLDTRIYQETSIPQVLFDCLGIPLGQQTQYEAIRVGKILHALRWEQGKRVRTGTQERTRMYVYVGTPGKAL